MSMTFLTSIHGSFAARVLAARLDDEGFDVELRGGLDNPYGLTVGDLARVDVYVPDDQIAAATLVLLDIEANSIFDDENPLRTSKTRRKRMGFIGTVIVAVIVIVAPVLRWWMIG